MELHGNLLYMTLFKVDGLSLLTACLKHWLSAGNRCPKVLVSTHFHSIIQQKLLPLTPLLRFQVGTIYNYIHVFIFIEYILIIY
jgi:DNA mismatch repair protein MSH5